MLPILYSNSWSSYRKPKTSRLAMELLAWLWWLELCWKLLSVSFKRESTRPSSAIPSKKQQRRQWKFSKHRPSQLTSRTASPLSKPLQLHWTPRYCIIIFIKVCVKKRLSFQIEFICTGGFPTIQPPRSIGSRGSTQSHWAWKWERGGLESNNIMLFSLCFFLLNV